MCVSSNSSGKHLWYLEVLNSSWIAFLRRCPAACAVGPFLLRVWDVNAHSPVFLMHACSFLIKKETKHVPHQSRFRCYDHGVSDCYVNFWNIMKICNSFTYSIDTEEGMENTETPVLLSLTQRPEATSGPCWDEVELCPTVICLFRWKLKKIHSEETSAKVFDCYEPVHLFPKGLNWSRELQRFA